MAGDKVNTSATSTQVPSFPTAIGDFNVCAQVKYTGNSDASDDKSCSTYKTVAAYTSESEIFAADLNVFYANISIGNENVGTKEVKIINVSGQTVMAETLSFEGGNMETINVSSLPAGACVINLGGTTTKFVR